MVYNFIKLNIFGKIIISIPLHVNESQTFDSSGSTWQNLPKYFLFSPANLHRHPHVWVKVWSFEMNEMKFWSLVFNRGAKNKFSLYTRTSRLTNEKYWKDLNRGTCRIR